MCRAALLLLLALPLSAEGWAPRDKQLHLAAGAVIATGGALAAQRLGSKHPEAWGFALAVGAGLAKEALDRRRKGHSCDFNDVTATALGGAVVSVSWRF